MCKHNLPGQAKIIFVTDEDGKQARVAAALREAISSGRYPPGTALPTLTEIAAAHQVSRVTARAAIAALRQEGLVASRQGSGNYVRETPPARRYGISRYARSVWAGSKPRRLLDAEAGSQGRAVSQETETARVPAPAWLAGRLPVAEGDLVHVRRRVTRIDGTVNQAADSYFTLETGEANPALITGEGAGGHIARISAVSPVTRVREEISARMPDAAERARLSIPEGTPVLEVTRTYLTAQGPLDVARFVIRADMAVFDYEFDVPD